MMGNLFYNNNNFVKFLVDLYFNIYCDLFRILNVNVFYIVDIKIKF